MNKIFLLACIGLSIFLFSCSDDSTKGIEISYEDVAGYVSNPTLVSEDAHSGRMCLKMDGDHHDGIVYKRKLSDISYLPVKEIIVSAWVKSSSGSETKATLVCALDSADKNVFWNGTDIAKYITSANDWYQMTVTVGLPNFAKQDYKLVIYPMNERKEPVWFDDLSITVAE